MQDPSDTVQGDQRDETLYICEHDVKRMVKERYRGDGRPVKLTTD